LPNWYHIQYSVGNHLLQQQEHQQDQNGLSLWDAVMRGHFIGSGQLFHESILAEFEPEIRR
jgi:hypothetical protein